MTIGVDEVATRDDDSPGVVIYMPPPSVQPTAQDLFIMLQSWEGYVLSIDNERITARLVDLTGDAPDEVGEFSWSEISDFDVPLVEPGAIFYWSVGQVQRPGGTRENRSQLRFRWMPVWRPEEIEKARREASELREDLFGS